MAMEYAQRILEESAMTPSVWNGVHAITTRHAGVIGGGTMGQGIVIAMLGAGHKVVLVEKDSDAVGYSKKCIEELLTKFRRTALLDQLSYTSDLNDLSKCDIIIEAIFESMQLKKELFSKLDKICSPKTILASNTSTLDIDEIASSTSRPQQVIGIHFFVPADRCHVIEIVLGKNTADDVVATAIDVTKRMKKTPIVVKNCLAFVGNRLVSVYYSEAMILVEKYGVLPRTIDKAVVEFGIPIGPFAMIDMISLDTFYRVSSESLSTVSLNVTKALLAKGRHGKKVDKGWYKYERQGRRRVAVPDPEVTQAVRQNAQSQRTFTNEEIIKRCFYPMVNEGFKIFEEHIVEKAQHIDAMWMLGYGWPAIRGGGPVRWGFEQGLPEIMQYLKDTGRQGEVEYMRPGKLITYLANQPNLDLDRLMARDLWRSKPSKL